MRDITAILVNYSDTGMLNKALVSLKKLDTRIKSIVIFRNQDMTPTLLHEQTWSNRIDYIDTTDPGKTLNDLSHQLDTSYALFLQEQDYISPGADTESFQLPWKRSVLETISHHRHIVIHRPLLVAVSLLKEKPFLSSHQLPFPEALFPAWLTRIDTSRKVAKENLVKQSWKSHSASIHEKEKIMQKYQMKTIKTEYPSISILIANYNMGKYVENAITSCILQNEQCDEILIVDDGSTDDSVKQLQRWEDEKQVHVFHKKNEGKAKALNQLLPHVTSEFILELDADDWLDPDAISSIKRHLSVLPEKISVLYGNLRNWKQVKDDVLFKGVSKGLPVNGTADLLSYRFPLGPRIYRTSTLKKAGGFPVIDFEDGRLYEDVSVLNRLIKNHPFRYRDFTVYNVREHPESITQNNTSKWHDFLNTLL